MKPKTFLNLILIIGTSFPVDAQKGFSIKGNEITLNFEIYKGKSLRLRTILPASYNPSVELESLEADNDAEIFLHITGENRNTHHGAKLSGASASDRLEFIEKTEHNTPEGKIITLVEHDPVKNLGKWNRFMNLIISRLLSVGIQWSPMRAPKMWESNI